MTEAWLAYVKEHVRADFETGQIYWKIPMRGRRVFKPMGCLDSNGYIKVQINLISTYAHSIIWFLAYGIWCDLIDHENRVRSDNRLNNLCESNHSKNALNSKMWNTNTSGIKGVSITPYGNFKVTKCGVYLGTFNSEETAIRAIERFERNGPHS